MVQLEHKCNLPINFDSVENIIAGQGGCSKLRINWLKIIQISSKNPLATKFYRSDKAIREERKRHLWSTHPYVIHPFSLLRVWYDIYLCFFHCFALFIKALDLGWEKRYEDVFPHFKIVATLVDVLCWLDICMNFCTGYIIPKRRAIELRLSKIATHYILGPYFFPDLLSSLPKSVLTLYLSHTWTSQVLIGTFLILSTLRVIRIITLIQLINRTAEYFRIRATTLLLLFNITIISFMVVHWLGAISFLVPKLSTKILRSPSDETKAWIYSYGIYYRSAYVRYSIAVFRSSAYLVGCRLGNLFRLVNTDDIIIRLISYVIGRILMAILWIVLASIILNSRTVDVKYDTMINEVTQYVQQKQLPEKLRDQLLIYYRFKYKGKYLKEEFITNLLSETLRKEVNAHVFKSLIKEVDIFKELSPSEITNVVSKLSERIFLPSDIIMYSGGPGDCMYFVASGTVALYSHSGKEICHLQEGCYFGEVSLLFPAQRRLVTVVAIEITKIYKLSKEDFLNLVATNRAVFKKMLHLAERRMMHVILSEKTYKDELVADDFRHKYAHSAQPQQPS